MVTGRNADNRTPMDVAGDDLVRIPDDADGVSEATLWRPDGRIEVCWIGQLMFGSTGERDL